MTIVRSLINRTEQPVSLTLLIQAGSDPQKIFGTRYVELAAGESQQIEYGDLHNSFLAGMDVKMVMAGTAITIEHRVVDRGDAIDQWLNGSEMLEIISPYDNTGAVLDAAAP